MHGAAESAGADAVGRYGDEWAEQPFEWSRGQFLHQHIAEIARKQYALQENRPVVSPLPKDLPKPVEVAAAG